MSEPLLPPPYPPPPYPPPPVPPPGFPPPGKRSAVPIVLAVVAAVLVLAVAIVVPVVLATNNDAKAHDEPGKSEVDTSSLAAVKEYPGLTNQHLAPGEEPDYPQSPPVGGDHAPSWLECGAYDESVPEANVVHDLEHGTVVLNYLPGLAGNDIEMLASKLPDNGILAPYPGLRAPVVVTVWGRQLDLRGADDPRLDLFIDQFGHGETAPEPFASCHGGVTPDQVEQGGVSAAWSDRAKMAPDV